MGAGRAGARGGAMGTMGTLGLGARLGPGYGDIETITTVSLSIDLINHADNAVVWSGTAYSDHTRQMLDHPAEAIDVATHQIFLQFPIARH